MTTETSQILSSSILVAIFSSAARIAVLRVFLLDPLRAYYQRQVEAATEQPIRAVQRELDRFTSIGLLYRRVEGNRTYHQVDVQFSLFPELRNMILKMAGPEDRLRGILAVDESVRLALYCESDGRILVVTTGGKRPALPAPSPFSMDVMSVEDFTHMLLEGPSSLEPFLRRGVDLLGRREEVIWRRIEAAGYKVEKRKGIP